MSEAVIQAEDLGKRYVISHQGVERPEAIPWYRGLPWGASPKKQGRSSEDFWALKDVSFDIKRGERLGVIGGNGAGKSTLLKILSMVTEPTEGLVRINGRATSLLEVGTGFHPELSGRENIFLNGTLLGMRRNEIKAKFDEIVAFAEIDRFLDTPVKRYSSGMYVRLAFAVAAHLSSDILIVDEVLAVGDAKFQERCLGKMKDAEQDGRTILFVSHSMKAIEDLCTKCVWLEGGRIKAQGETREIIKRYLELPARERGPSEWLASDGSRMVENRYFRPVRMAVVDRQLAPLRGSVGADEEVGLLVEGEVEDFHALLTFGFAIFTASGQELFWTLHTDLCQSEWPQLKKGQNKFVVWLPAHLLNEGEYRVDLHMGLHCQEWFSQPGVTAPSVLFQVAGNLSPSPLWTFARPGLLAPHLKFNAL